MSRIITSFIRITIAATMLCAAAPGLFAQDYEKEGQKPAEDTAAQAEAAGLAAESSEQPDKAGPDVTYEQVLADPDNIVLNYDYARAQVRRGDLKGAAATLERILMVDPGRPKLRLLYAIILYRLDNMAEARRELDTVKSLDIPDDVRAEAEKYSQAIEKRTKRTHLSGRLSVGFEFNDNRTAVPDSGQMLFNSVQFNLTGSSAKKRSDINGVVIAGIMARRELDMQAGHELFTSLTYYRADQSLVKTINLQAYSVKAGGIYKNPFMNLTPFLSFDHVFLAGHTFLYNLGGGVKAEKKLSKKTDLFLEVKSIHQDHVGTPNVPVNPQRSGMRIDASARISRLVSPTRRFSTELIYACKNADKSYNSFTRYGFGFKHSWLLGKGMFFLASVGFNYDYYHVPDVAITRDDRLDSAFRAGVTYGAPLKLLHSGLKDLVWTFGGEYCYVDSTVLNYAYTNHKIMSLLTYKWEIGL